MSHRMIVVDDTDPLFHYTEPEWFQDQGSQDNLGNFGPPFQHTLHGTNSNTSFSFSFQGVLFSHLHVSPSHSYNTGTSIQILGTNNRVNTTSGFDPSWECFVDNVSIGSTQPFQYPENNWLLCQQLQLADGPHVVTVNVTQATAAGRTFWFDDATYTPSPNLSKDQAYVLVDNLDPDIVYGAGWAPLGTTANFTTQAGTEMSFNFTGVFYCNIFNVLISSDNSTAGKGLSWFGFIPTELSHNPASATYAIDGGIPVTFRLNGLSQAASPTIYNQIFFSTPELSAGPHSLHVVHRGTDKETPLTLDYIVVTNTSVPNTSTPHSVSKTSNIQKTPIGAIVGGIVGGIVLIIFALGALLWRRRRRRGVQILDDPRPQVEVSPLVVPTYNSSSTGIQSSASNTHISYSTSMSLDNDPHHSSLYPLPTTLVVPSTSNTNHTSMSTLEDGRSTVSSDRAVQKQHKELLRLEYSHPKPVVYQDSGRRFYQGGDVDTEVPPRYSED